MDNRAMQIEWIMLASEPEVMEQRMLLHRAMLLEAEVATEPGSTAPTEQPPLKNRGGKSKRKTSSGGIEVVGPPLWVRKYKEGYILRREKWRLPGCGDNWEKECGVTEITAAYTLDGDYIGDAKTARLLCRKYGIKPERRKPDSTICSIGFSEKKGGWCGWSHRAIYCFKPGHVVSKGDVGEQYVKAGFRAKNMEDAKKLAVAFARGVS